jgi:acyl-CoA reductase-like NAD-dependent aldehyde dehydrogenase
VHQSQYDDLRAILDERVKKLRLGSVMSTTDEGYVHTVDCGAMISDNRFAGLERMLKDAEEGGAIIEGGSRYNKVTHPQGTYFRPAVVGPVTPDMDIANHECTFSRTQTRAAG